MNVSLFGADNQRKQETLEIFQKYGPLNVPAFASLSAIPPARGIYPFCEQILPNPTFSGSIRMPDHRTWLVFFLGASLYFHFLSNAFSHCFCSILFRRNESVFNRDSASLTLFTGLSMTDHPAYFFLSQPESHWKGKKMERLQRNYRLGQNGKFEIKSPNNDVLQLEVENGNITVNPNTDGWQIERHERSTSGGNR